MSATRSSRVLLRTARTARQTRFNTTQVPPKSSGGFHPGVTGAIAGAGAATIIGYGAYHFSGAKDLVNTAAATKKYFTQSTAALKGDAPSTSEALEWLRTTAGHYAIFIPGGRAFLDSAFSDIDAVRAKHSDKIDSLVSDAYTELQKTTEEKGLSMEAAVSVWAILQDKLGKMAELAKDAAGDVMERHPEFKEQLGGRLEQLKGLGGEDAKQKIDETWGKISKLVANGKGASSENIEAAKKIIDDVLKDAGALGDKAWSEGLKQAKPYLDKLPSIRKTLEENGTELMKKADFRKLWQKVQEAAEKKDPKVVQEYVDEVLKDVKKTGEKAGKELKKDVK